MNRYNLFAWVTYVLATAVLILSYIPGGPL